MAIWSHLIADVHWIQLKISIALPTQEVCSVTDFYRCDLQSLVEPHEGKGSGSGLFDWTFHSFGSYYM